MKLIVEKFRGDNAVQAKTIVKHEDEIADLHKEARKSDEVIKALRLEDKAKAHSITQLNNKYKKAVQDHSSVSSKFYKINRVNNSLNEEVVRLK